MNYKDIKTIEDAYKYLGTEQPNLSALSVEDARLLLTYHNITTVAKAINKAANGGEVWEPNWNDYKQWKYYPWFYVEASSDKPSGFGFSYPLYGRTGTYAIVGSRLSYISGETAMYAAKQFEELYKKYLLIIK